jgi:drug/metabolite transporter (DMT)-like permease
MFTMLAAIIFKQETVNRRIVAGVCVVVLISFGATR